MAAKPLLEIITADFRDAGHRGPLTRKYLDQWRKENPAYGAAKLSAMFSSGSSIQTVGKTRLDRATVAWRKAGNPSPSSPDFDREKFDAFLAGYRDEFDEESYS